MPSRAPRAAAAALFAAALLSSTALAATTYEWKSPASGTFAQVPNWSRADGLTATSFPVAGDTATFDQPHAFTVTFSSSAASDVLNFPSGDVTFTSTGGQKNYLLTTGLAQANLTDGTLTLGISGGAMTLNVGSLTLSTGHQLRANFGSDIITSNLAIGTVASPSSTSLSLDGAGSSLTVNGPAAVAASSASASLSLSNQSAGTITGAVTVGDDTSAGSLSLSSSSLTTGSLSLSSSTLSLASASTLTLTAASTLNIGSPTSTATTATLANSTLKTGTGLTTVNQSASLAVTGSSSFQLNGDLLVNAGSASFSPGTLIWAANKSLSTSAAGSISVTTAAPFALPANASLHVNSASFTLAPASPDIDSTLVFSPGSSADVSAAGSLTTTAIQLGSTGTSSLTVDGPGSSLAATGSSYSSSIASGTGTASLTLRNAATATFDNTLSVASTGSSAIGTITVQSGATLFAHDLDLATASTGLSRATFSLTGSGSALLLSGSLTAGNPASTSSTTVANGASLIQGDTTMSPIGVPIGAGLARISRGHTLTVNGGFVSLGTLAADPSTISLLAGSLGFDGPLVVGDTGALGFSLTLGPAQSLALTGNTTVNVGGSLSLVGGALSTASLINNGSLSFTAGTLALTGPAGLSISPAGPLGSSPNLSTGKSLLVSYTTTLPSTSSLFITGGSLATASLANSGSLTVNNYGSLTVSSSLSNTSTGRLFLGPDLTSTFDGPATNAGRITLQGGSTRVVGASALTNTGLITGDGEIAKPLLNSTAGELRAEQNKTLLLSGPAVTSAGKINLQGGAIEFSNPLTNTGSILGRGTLTANVGLTNNGSASFSAGTSDVYGPVTNNSKILVTGSSTTTFYDPLTNSPGADIFTAANSSVVFLAPVNGPGTFSGPGTKYFSDGTSTTAALESSGLTVVSEAASLTTPDFIEQSLTVNGSLITPHAATPHASKTQSLTLGPTGSLDLANNPLILDYTPAANAPQSFSPFTLQPSSFTSSLRQYLYTHQLFSSTADGDPQHLLAIGYIDNALLNATTWSTLPVDPTSILTKITFYGDANLDGKVNADDYALLDRGFAQHASTWTDGDFNYDGQVTPADYLLIDRTLLIQAQGFETLGLLAQRESQFGAQYVSTLLASVPEPSSLLACGFAIPALRRRRTTP